MRSPILYAVLIISAAILAFPTNAQFAQDNVNSDGYGNTGVGADALFTLTPSEESLLVCSANPAPTCVSNTAMGDNAMYGNTSGAYNTAIGAGALFKNSEGSSNTAVGVNALYNNTFSYNTAVGYEALADNTSVGVNTAVGYSALSANTDGSDNTAVGEYSLGLNQGSFNTALGATALNGTGASSTGSSNTAVGSFALTINTTGNFNTASGSSALTNNASGSNNTASGYSALANNYTGNNNTASGYDALYGNTDMEPTGSNNTGTGAYALYSYSSGSDNVASGVNALNNNTIGMYNTATGTGALVKNLSGNYNVAEGAHAGGALTSGSSNIAVGYEAGDKLTTGSNNIHIGSPGVAADDGVIRIGTITGTTSTQSATYIAGIYKVTITSGLPVVIDSKGQLGTTSSSERFKTAIKPMESTTAKLLELRPVTFRYKADPQSALRYGLIAEEVAKVYPELVVRDATTGRIDGVRYDELAPMLLNEVQKQQRIYDAQATEMSDLRLQVAEMHAALLKLQAKDERVAQR